MNLHKRMKKKATKSMKITENSFIMNLIPCLKKKELQLERLPSCRKLKLSHSQRQCNPSWNKKEPSQKVPSYYLNKSRQRILGQFQIKLSLRNLSFSQCNPSFNQKNTSQTLKLAKPKNQYWQNMSKGIMHLIKSLEIKQKGQ